MKFCGRCGKSFLHLYRFCDGKYHFCDFCTKEWFELLEASGSGMGFNAKLFDWWLKHSNLYNPSKRFVK